MSLEARRPLWIAEHYSRELGARVVCLRCQATHDGLRPTRERFDFELLHSLCPAPGREEPA